MSNNGGVYTWSQTAASNATADATVNWQEGQAPSSINDSGRAMMASVAKFRDDISGSIVTTGTSVAYIVASNQVFDTEADFNGQIVAFTPHVTNGAGPVTVTVDGFANLPLRSAPNVELPSGVLIQGTPYVARFSQADNALYLHGFFGNPYVIPIGASLEFWGTTAPNSSFALPFGQAISRTTYAALFSLFGTQYGAGDGSTTFNIPDVRGRLTPAMDNMGGTAANRVTSAGSGINGVALGAVGGAEIVTLAQSGLPNIVPTITIHDPGHNHSVDGALGNAAQAAPQAGNNLVIQDSTVSGTSFTGITATSSSINGGVTQTPTIIMPPSIVCNRILRII